MDINTLHLLSTAARDNAERLARLGHPVPKALTDAFALRDAVDLQPDPGPVADALADATPKNVAAKVDAWIARRIQIEALQRHQVDLLDELGRRILLAHQLSSEAIFDSCRDGFAKAAADFTEAFAHLPENWRDSSALVRSGPATVEHFQKATAAVAVLDQYREIRQATPGGGQAVMGEVPTGLEYADCEDTLVARQACAVRAGGTLGRWGDLLDIEGVTGLVWRSPSELTAAVRACPVVEMRPVKNGMGYAYEKRPVPA